MGNEEEFQIYFRSIKVLSGVLQGDNRAFQKELEPQRRTWKKNQTRRNTSKNTSDTFRKPSETLWNLEAFGNASKMALKLSLKCPWRPSETPWYLLKRPWNHSEHPWNQMKLTWPPWELQRPYEMPLQTPGIPLKPLETSLRPPEIPLNHFSNPWKNVKPLKHHGIP